jgi:hypothetical protein
MGRTADVMASVFQSIRPGRFSRDPEKAEELHRQMQRGNALAQLKQHPGWPVFVSIMERRKQMRFNELVNERLTQEQLAASQAAYRELDVLMKEFDREVELAREASKKIDELETKEQ